MIELITLVGGPAKNFVDVSGKYMGSYSSSPSTPKSYDVPKDWIHVPSAPTSATQVWLFPGWSGDGVAESLERDWRDKELTRADIELNKAQDGDGIGSVKSWRDYRKSLRAWPTSEYFPSAEFRPIAPDNYKE